MTDWTSTLHKFYKNCYEELTAISSPHRMMAVTPCLTVSNWNRQHKPWILKMRIIIIFNFLQISMTATEREKLISTTINFGYKRHFLSDIPSNQRNFHWFRILGPGMDKRKVGGIRYEARSRGRSSPDSLAFWACETPRRLSRLLPGRRFLVEW